MVEYSKRSSRTKAKQKNSKQSKQRQTKKRSSKRKGAQSKTRQRSQTISKSHTVTPTKDHSDERKLKAKVERMGDFKEKEPESEGKKEKRVEKTNESISKSKGSQVMPPGHQVEPPKKIEVKNLDPDEKKMKHLIKKLKKERAAPRAPSIPLDEKSKLMMDRVIKKPYPLKYKNKSNELCLTDEKSSFFKPTIPQKRGSSIGSKRQPQVEDDYSDCPKLANVLKLSPGKDIYAERGWPTPYWVEIMDDETMEKFFQEIGVELAQAIDSRHLVDFQEKKFELKTVNEKVTMDAFQPLVELKKRDENHFNDQLVFSNTLRCVINMQNITSEASSGAQKMKKKDSKTKKCRVRIRDKSPEWYTYSRSNRFSVTHASKSATNTVE